MAEPAPPIDPEVLASVAESWRRIDAWLAKHAPSLAAQMRKGATPGAIAEAEAALGVTFPDAVRASYSIHDGSGVESLFPTGDYLPLEEMLEQYSVWKQLVEEGTFDGIEREPDGPIQKVHYHLKWIPLTHDGGGNHMLLDLAPAEWGNVGQLVEFDHETGAELVIGDDLAEYLSYVAGALAAGAATVGEGAYLEWDEDPEA